MRYLIDTQIVLWQLMGDRRTTTETKKIIEDPMQEKFVSVASLWEVAIKQSIGKLQMDLGVNELWGLLEAGNVEVLPISAAQLMELSDLPQRHKDPFDRLIIATALAHGLVVVTSDKVFSEYPVEVFMQRRDGAFLFHEETRP